MTRHWSTLFDGCGAREWTRLIGPVEVGPIAHGGHCVARHEGRVIFVRHALPGERVMVQITDDSHARFWRGDAVQVLEPSPDRVRGTVPGRRARTLRRLRLPARRARGPAPAEGLRWSPSSSAGWPGSTGPARSSR